MPGALQCLGNPMLVGSAGARARPVENFGVRGHKLPQ